MSDVRKPAPKPRGFHRIECTDTSLYLIGGYDENDEVFREVWRFDFVSETWRKLETRNTPQELDACYTVLNGNLLFLYGGINLSRAVSRESNSLYFCRLPKDRQDEIAVTFEEIVPTSAYRPLPCSRHSMVLNGDHLYVVGGKTKSGYSMDVDAFNLETRKWTNLYGSSHQKDSPAARQGHGLICYNDRLYLFGGGTFHKSFSLAVLPAFNLKTNRWETFKTTGDVSFYGRVPSERQSHGCVQRPQEPSIVYVNGGSLDGDCGILQRDTWRIDLDTLEWTRIFSLMLFRRLGFHSVATTPDGRMLVFGGYTDGGRPTAELYSTWILVPKLQDICWKAILHYFRAGYLKQPSSDSVKNLRLPPKYEKRLVVSGANFSPAEEGDIGRFNVFDASDG
jgi:hypothetical protein